MKKILVPIDFSEYSENALKAAASLAKKYNSEIIALHLLGMSDAYLSKSDNEENQKILLFMQLAKRRFDEFLDKPYLKDVKLKDTINEFMRFEDINDVAQKEQADLIVMGSHGATGLKEVFVGSNTEKVVRTSEIPVLVVKKDRDIYAVNNILYACDFDSKQLEVHKKIKNFADLVNADVKYLYVNTPGSSFLNQSEINQKIDFVFDALGWSRAEQEVIIYNDYSIESGVLNYCNENEVDMIAVATSQRRGIAHFLMGSVSEDIVNHADLPVLTIKFD